MENIRELSAFEIVELVELNIDNCYINYNQMESIKEILHLKCMNVKELRSTRNSVVKSLFELIRSAREKKDYVIYDKLMATMSGTTATIDNMIYEQGGEV